MLQPGKLRLQLSTLKRGEELLVEQTLVHGVRERRAKPHHHLTVSCLAQDVHLFKHLGIRDREDNSVRRVAMIASLAGLDIVDMVAS